MINGKKHTGSVVNLMKKLLAIFTVLVEVFQGNFCLKKKSLGGILVDDGLNFYPNFLS